MHSEKPAVPVKSVLAVLGILASLVVVDYRADAVFAILPAVIAGGASLLGGILGWKSNRDANKANAAIADKNMAMQKEFATHGVRWKVADAQAAGLHPLAALGTNTANFSPVSGHQIGDTSMPNALASMGQDVSRAVHATRTQDERTKAMADLSLENASLQNDLLRSQIAKINANMNPAFPGGSPGIIEGQGNSQPTAPEVIMKPLERIKSSATQPAQEVGEVPDYGFVRTPTGLAVVPSKDVKEKIEDQFIPEAMWALRNQLLPNLGGGPTPPDPSKYPLPRGAVAWKWSRAAQEFRPVWDLYNIKEHQFKQRKLQGRTKAAPWH